MNLKKKKTVSVNDVPADEELKTWSDICNEEKKKKKWNAKADSIERLISM